MSAQRREVCAQERRRNRLLLDRAYEVITASILAEGTLDYASCDLGLAVRQVFRDPETFPFADAAMALRHLGDHLARHSWQGRAEVVGGPSPVAMRLLAELLVAIHLDDVGDGTKP